MRKILTFAMAVLAVLSCSRESIDTPQEEPIQPDKKTINLTIVAGNPSDDGTRTELVGTTPYWSRFDNLGVTSLTMDEEYFDEYGEESYDRSIFEISGDIFPVDVANFNGQIDVTDDVNQALYAYYPGIPAYRYFDYSVFDEAPDYYGPVNDWFFDIFRFDTELVGPRVLVSKFQQPTSTSFDEAADVLVAEPFSLSDCNYDEDEEHYTLPNLRFARMVSVIELYLNSGENGPFEGLQPEYVELGYEGNNAIPLTGPAFIEFPTTKNDVPALHPQFENWPPVDNKVYAYLGAYGNNSPVGPDGPVDPDGPEGPVNRYTITAQPEDGPFINPIYLVVFPGTLKAGGDLTIYAANMDEYFGIGRSIHLNTNIVLQPGKITTLVIDMTGDEDDLIIQEKNTPGSIELESIIHVDQYDNVELVASVSGKNPEEEIDVNEELFTCTFRDKNGDDKDIDYSLSYYDEIVTITMPQLDEVVDLTVQVCYGTISSNECSLIVHEAKEIPAALADWSYREGFSKYNDDWFEEYRVDRRAIDGKVYLKQYAASLRTEELPDYAFAGSFTSEETGGVFDALECFSHITSIPSNAFKACTSLKGVSLPPLVESIGDFAFQGCSGLVSIVLPDGVETIGESAFSACSKLSEVTISSTSALNSIGESAFEECTSLGGFYLPSGVTEISSSAFYGCSMLSNINLDNVTSIGSSAFNGCALNEVSLNGCTLIGFSAFYGCSALTSVTIETSSENGMELGSSAFAYCTNLNSITLPSNLEIMPSSCFEGCTSLQSITLPKSLLTIDEAAFFQSGLTSISLPGYVTSIGRLAFDDCALTSMVIPESVVSIGGYAFGSSFDYIVFMGTTPPSIDVSCFFYTRGDFIAYVPDGYVQAYVGAWCDEWDDTSWIKSINELTPSSN